MEDETGDDVGFGDAKVLSLKVGDVLQIGNGFVTSFKGEWKINVGARAKYGEITRV